MRTNDPTCIEMPGHLQSSTSRIPVYPFSPIKLLKFLVTFGFGGTERQVVNLVSHLDRANFSVNFGCIKRWGQFLSDVERQSIPITEYRIQKLYMPSTFIQQLRLSRQLRRQQIQILHSYNFYANAFAIPAAKMARIPVIVAGIRDTGMGISPSKVRIHRMICHMADSVVVNAEAVREWLVAQGYNGEKITVIYNGIDLKRLIPLNRITPFRQNLGVTDDAPLVLVMARLAPQKGIETFLEAAAVVSVKHPKVRFLIVGDMFTKTRKDGFIEPDVSYQQRLTRHASRLGLAGRVIFTGYRADVAELLSQTAISVLPSHSGEGLSNSLLESMAAGVPVVATRVGGNSEVIGTQGVAGLLVKPRDANALAQAILAILENKELSQRLSSAARLRVAEKFTLSRMVHDTENHYASLLECSQKRIRDRRFSNY